MGDIGPEGLHMHRTTRLSAATRRLVLRLLLDCATGPMSKLLDDRLDDEGFRVVVIHLEDRHDDPNDDPIEDPNIGGAEAGAMGESKILERAGDLVRLKRRLRGYALPPDGDMGSSVLDEDLEQTLRESKDAQLYVLRQLRDAGGMSGLASMLTAPEESPVWRWLPIQQQSVGGKAAQAGNALLRPDSSIPDIFGDVLAGRRYGPSYRRICFALQVVIGGGPEKGLTAALDVEVEALINDMNGIASTSTSTSSVSTSGHDDKDKDEGADMAETVKYDCLDPVGWSSATSQENQTRVDPAKVHLAVGALLMAALFTQTGSSGELKAAQVECLKAWIETVSLPDPTTDMAKPGKIYKVKAKDPRSPLFASEEDRKLAVWFLRGCPLPPLPAGGAAEEGGQLQHLQQLAAHVSIMTWMLERRHARHGASGVFQLLMGGVRARGAGARQVSPECWKFLPIALRHPELLQDRLLPSMPEDELLMLMQSSGKVWPLLASPFIFLPPSPPAHKFNS